MKLGTGSKPSPRQPLPDLFGPNMKILFVGINPGLRSAALGHHFAGFNNRFWKLLHESGLVDFPIGFEDDWRLPELGFGLTNVVARSTRSCSELTLADYAEGRARLFQEITAQKPRIVACIGVMVFRALFDEKGAVECGLKSERIGDARVYVLPNPSGRNAHFSYARMLEIYRDLARVWTSHQVASRERRVAEKSRLTTGAGNRPRRAARKRTDRSSASRSAPRP